VLTGIVLAAAVIALLIKLLRGREPTPRAFQIFETTLRVTVRTRRRLAFDNFVRTI
jgi:hypothetical protein